eukprot:30966-Pelagococcus_subviridis.AAC.6
MTWPAVRPSTRSRTAARECTPLRAAPRLRARELPRHARARAPRRPRFPFVPSRSRRKQIGTVARRA